MSDPTNVVEALACVMRDLPGIGKDGTAAAQQGGYKYRGIEAITAEVQKLFAKYGVIPVPRVRHRLVNDIEVNAKPWTDTYLEVDWSIYGPGGVEDRIEASTFGHGRDNSDKGTNKAMTQAFKYLLLDMLCISDPADDNDGTHDAADGRPVDNDQQFYQQVNGETIPLDLPMDTTRTGPEGELVTEADGKRIFAMAKSVDDTCNVNAVCESIIGRAISHTSKLTKPEYQKVYTELKRRGA